MGRDWILLIWFGLSAFITYRILGFFVEDRSFLDKLLILRIEGCGIALLVFFFVGFIIATALTLLQYLFPFVHF